MTRLPSKIVAPVCAPEEVESILRAGADELYCGAMENAWAAEYGNADLLSRRQGRSAHLRDRGEMRELLRQAAACSVAVALTLNARYSQPQMAAVLDLAQFWEDNGGSAVLVSDMGLLLQLARRGSELRRHLSVLAGALNSDAVAFFRELGASRIVLPRDLDIAEMASLIAATPPDLEFECLAAYQKCQFSDGMCFFHHAVRFPENVPALFDYELPPGSMCGVAYSSDPDYEGHGCQLQYQLTAGSVQHAQCDDLHTPHCAACCLSSLLEAGVSLFKIAGRAYPTEMIVRAVHFVRQALTIHAQASSLDEARRDIRRLYGNTFGGGCDESRCYYALRATP